MKKNLFALGLLTLLISGCEPEKPAGLGIVPMQGATVTGRVVEASEPSGVLVKTDSKRSFLLPDSWEYRQNGKPVSARKLAPGSTVTALAPAHEARLVSAADNTLVLQSQDDFYSFPYEGLGPTGQQIPVGVQTFGGRYDQMPLGQALSNSDVTVMSNPYYQNYQFASASPQSIYKGQMVGSYQNAPLMLTPTGNGIQMVSLPQSYPRQTLASNQPVRFAYADDDVRVSSWDTLGDGQFNLSNILLAGTLLDILPGQAVIQVGQNPVTVPWDYVTYQGAPIGQQRYPVGTPLGVNYHPGAYDFVSYDYNNVTMLYNDQVMQMPVNCLPPQAFDRRVKVRKNKGGWVSVPFRSAQQWADNGDCYISPSSRALDQQARWGRRRAPNPRGLRGVPGYQLVGNNGWSNARVVRTDGRHARRGHNDYRDDYRGYGNQVAYRPAYTSQSMMGLANWSQPRLGKSHGKWDGGQTFGGRPQVGRRDDDRRQGERHQQQVANHGGRRQQQAANHGGRRQQQAANHGGRRQQQADNHGGRRQQQVANHGGRRQQQVANHGGRRQQQAANHGGRRQQQAANHGGRRQQQVANHGGRRQQQAANRGGRRQQQVANHGGRRQQQAANHGGRRQQQASRRQAAPRELRSFGGGGGQHGGRPRGGERHGRR